ncbi:hypothetical protein KKF86_06420, partial [bacterium]|nr:hypothetical protein [bacterium]
MVNNSMKIFSNFVLLVLFILFLSCKPEEPTTPNNNDLVMPNVTSIGGSNKIEIVTWNVEHFPKTKYSDDYVQAIIEGLDADLYVLQEIQSPSKFGSMLNEMDEYNYYLQTNSIGLNLAVIYKSGLINIKSSIELLFTQEDDYFAGRPPLLVNLEWQKNGITKNLTIINVHYKCCGDDSISYVPDEDGKLDEEYCRLKASELLEKYIS